MPSLDSQDFQAVDVQLLARDLSDLSTSRFPTMQSEVWDLKLLLYYLLVLNASKKKYLFFHLQALLKGIKGALPLWMVI